MGFCVIFFFTALLCELSLAAAGACPPCHVFQSIVPYHLSYQRGGAFHRVTQGRTSLRTTVCPAVQNVLPHRASHSPTLSNTSHFSVRATLGRSSSTAQPPLVERRSSDGSWCFSAACVSYSWPLKACVCLREGGCVRVLIYFAIIPIRGCETVPLAFVYLP